VDDRRKSQNLSTEEIASGPARSTEELRDSAERAERARMEGIPAGAERDPWDALFPERELHELRGRWSNIQSAFVDEPRRSVEEADGLVAQMVKRLAESFADARSKLEGQWSRGGDVSTEELRLTLRRYRSFFDRLLSA
jgi:hypothetical protein